ncbi:MAG: DUF2252 domain-containing protein [Candidatus Nanopelagicales bacterium]
MSDPSRVTRSATARQWEVGRRARKRVPRSRLGAWVAQPDRPDPVGLLMAQEAGRVPELVPLRYERMTTSEFAFYRGAAAIMASDLGSRGHTDLTVQLTGDAHLANFGGFAAPDRTMIFDLNDFDETLPGPFEWDVQRLVASFAVAARHKGFPVEEQDELVRAVATTYRTAVARFAAMSRLDVWYARMTAQELLDRWTRQVDAPRVAKFRKVIDKGQSKTSSKAVSRYTQVGGDGALRLISRPPQIVSLEDLAQSTDGAAMRAYMDDVLANYTSTLSPDRAALIRGFHSVSGARKVVGVGSVGTRCFIVLLVNEDDDNDDLVLQLKQAGPSVLESVLPASAFPHHGQRVVEGQRMIQAASDVLLGWTTVTTPAGDAFDFYVRQMWDWKTSADLETMDLVGFHVYARICGWTLARAHSRSGRPKALSAYLGSGVSFDKAMIEFAGTYADQNTHDFRALLTSIKDGRVQRSDIEGGGVPIDV